MTFSLRKILSDQRDLLFFRPFKPDMANHGLDYLAWGLFTTWLVGVGRYWDHPDAQLWQYLGLGSVAYVFVLAGFLWLIALPLKPRNWSYRNVLLFVMLTSLPALLYAIPVERFMSLANAQAVNVWFLATVAIWRVGLLLKFLHKAAGFGQGAVVVVGFLPLVLIVAALTALNLERAVFDIMGGLGTSTPNDSAYAVLIVITVLSVWASPFLLIAYGVMVYKKQTAA